ncbi:MAG: ATP-binding protein [Pseudomonadota bacterium]
MDDLITADIAAVQSISAVPVIMRVLAETTGLRFVCVARVTPESWTTCAVLDSIGFGLNPGDELDIATTICNEVRANNAAVIIDKVSTDKIYHNHPTPEKYGFESYFSIPIYRAGGEFFGTLCGLDSRPAHLSTPKIRDTLFLFADLISRQLEAENRLTASDSALRDERETSELREQFIAVLGHDLRTPLSSIVFGVEVLKQLSIGEKANTIVQRIERSGRRITSLVDDVMDFTRGRMGGGMPLALRESSELGSHLHHVIEEIKSAHGNRIIRVDIELDGSVFCDQDRIAQLLSNLLLNALVHGQLDKPVAVSASRVNSLLTITVSNAGPPIPTETMSRLFQPFWRGTGEKKSAGLGLGLYIASEIARSHNGTLGVISDTEATTFTFTTNLARNPATAP